MAQISDLDDNPTNSLMIFLFVYTYFLRYALVSVILNVMLCKASSVLVNNRSEKPVHIFNLKKRHERQREAEKQLYHASAPTTGHIRIDEVSRFIDIF